MMHFNSKRVMRRLLTFFRTASFSVATVAVSAHEALAAGAGWGQIVSGAGSTKKGGGGSVPEPATWMLLATGIGGLSWLLRKRK
jgi:hypothetical protein